MPNASRKRDSCVLKRVIGFVGRLRLLEPEHLVEADDPLLQLDALQDQLLQPRRQRAEIPARLIAPLGWKLDLALLLEGLLRA